MDKAAPSVKINMLMNAVLTASSIVFPLITLPYITRVLGPQYLGKVYLSHSVVMLFAMAAELGIPVYGIKACAKVRDDITELSRTAHEIIAINLVSCAVSYILLAVSVIVIPGIREERVLITVMSSVIVLNSLGMEWLYKALEKYTYITVRSLIFKTIALAAMFMLVKSKDDYITYGFLTVSAASASNILNMINARRYLILRPVGGYDLRRHLRGMLLLFMLAAAVNIYTSLDVAVLGLISGDAAAGLYGVSARIKAALVSMITSVSAVLLPRTSFYYEKGEESSFEGLISRTLRLVVTASVLTAVYFAAFARDIINVLAGTEFDGAAASLRILMPALVIIAVSNVIGMQMLVPMDREKTVAAAAGAGAVTDLVLNLLLIPHYGPSGAAAATLVAEIIVLLCLVHSSGMKIIKSLLRGMPFAAIIVTAAAGAAVSIAASARLDTAFLRLAVSGICFFAVCGSIILIYERNRKKRD